MKAGFAFTRLGPSMATLAGYGQLFTVGKPGTMGLFSFQRGWTLSFWRGNALREALTDPVSSTHTRLRAVRGRMGNEEALSGKPGPRPPVVWAGLPG